MNISFKQFIERLIFISMIALGVYMQFEIGGYFSDESKEQVIEEKREVER